ncbi:recombinase family protein [Rhodococcus sp. NPDC019627]|uniref:recombinase family protein n=1 Tax=unclassified Rhodococcus (in: high G+C Gram-positive bacteria) TaxID=192944 RepID=UPI0033FF14E1
MRVFIYCRISKDRTGAGLGVERQEADCRRLADSLGWDVVFVYADNDISAYSGKPRPGYTAMLDALRRGEAEAIIAWHTDRLHRSPAELETFINLCETNHVTVRTVQSGELDLSTPAGQMTARIVGAVARHEIDHARKRMSSAHAQSAKNGNAHGRVPWGYKAVVDDVSGSIINRVPHPQNAPIIQEAARRILAGETGYSIAKSFNERGVPTPQGGARWHTWGIHTMVKSPTYAGFRTHKGFVTKGTWEPIITAEDHEKIVALLSKPGRRSHRGTEPKYLLSGIAICGVCKSVVHRNKSHGRDAYTCSANTRCVSRNLKQVDDYITKAVLARCKTLSIPSKSRQDPEAAAAADEARTLQETLEEYEEMAQKLEIAPASFKRIAQELQRKIEDAERRAAPSFAIPELEQLAGPNAPEVWKGMGILGKRNVVRALMTVEIKRSSRGTRKFRLEDIDITPIRL